MTTNGGRVETGNGEKKAKKRGKAARRGKNRRKRAVFLFTKRREKGILNEGRRTSAVCGGSMNGGRTGRERSENGGGDKTARRGNGSTVKRARLAALVKWETRER